MLLEWHLTSGGVPWYVPSFLHFSMKAFQLASVQRRLGLPITTTLLIPLVTITLNLWKRKFFSSNFHEHNCFQFSLHKYNLIVNFLLMIAMNTSNTKTNCANVGKNGVSECAFKPLTTSMLFKGAVLNLTISASFDPSRVFDSFGISHIWETLC